MTLFEVLFSFLGKSKAGVGGWKYHWKGPQAKKTNASGKNALTYRLGLNYIIVTKKNLNGSGTSSRANKIFL